MTTKPPAEPKWLTVDMVLAIHDEQLALFGGGEGIRDAGLLESGLARAPNRHHYDPDATLFELAAAYGIGIIKNHPFIDLPSPNDPSPEGLWPAGRSSGFAQAGGNKRTGLISMHVFLFLNGWRFEAGQVDEVQVILALASGDLEEDELARWIKANSRKA